MTVRNERVEWGGGGVEREGEEHAEDRVRESEGAREKGEGRGEGERAIGKRREN